MRVLRVLPSILAVLAIAVLGLVGNPSPPAAEAATSYDGVVDITFPVAGKSSYVDDYAHCRSGCARRHRATDIMAPRGADVHAAMGGTISFITGLDSAPPSYGYMIRIAGDDGRVYNYIHLGRQDRGPSEAYAKGMRRGLRVERGQLIGYVGCSGNASCSAPHLHFEITDTSLTDPYNSNQMNPYRSLKAAQQRGDLGGMGVSPRSFPLVGDWDASGRDGIGWWRDGQVRLRTSGGQEHSFVYGRTGDVPVVADWNGDGRETVSVIRDGTWHLNNQLQGGSSSSEFVYGRVSRGDVPIAGSWDGKKHDLPGIVRDREWHLRNSQSAGPATWSFVYGRLTGGDLPLWGDWNGNGTDSVGIVRQGEWHLRNKHAAGGSDIAYIYGRVNAGDRPVVGDWNGDGKDTPGIVRDGRWMLKSNHGAGHADMTVDYPSP